MTVPVKTVANLAGIVLAAGGSTRLGQPKQLVEMSGRPLVCHALGAAAGSCGAGLVVVTGDAAAEVEAALEGYRVQVVRNADWEQGLAGSIATGTDALAALNFDAVLFMLCDQPYVDQHDIARLAAVWQNAPARPAAAVYEDKIGVPAIFPATYLDRLSTLKGDRGAQALLNEIPGVSRVELASAGFDVDTADDLQKLQGP
ncbi:MAG: nucleotidyltransferase family protein [Gammaproteobacteria bacterium]|jgi:molybdenum cofactor cytidylyltransferase|nr:nucleotidyltransferase family protein [Gammaproteobacteria bacterium]MDP6617607.1 nucleotidyltransferase family protein [Gammaproteobacteria bacterium]MDP6694484.1 nucleotidyltransferase family protein [Gammaproteobacteria bacterium]